MNKKFAVLGSPITHSLSPNIHSSAYKVLSKNWTYDRHDVGADDFAEFMANNSSVYSGFSVTMPLKELAFQIADFHDELSTKTNTSNTLFRINGKIHGYNTDVFGITQAISEAHSKPIKKVLILGSGATAKSAVVALSKFAPSAQIQVMARNSETRGDLILFAKSLSLRAASTYLASRALRRANLVICTLPSKALDPLAKKLASNRFFKVSGLLLDVAYNPWPSEIAKLWQSRGGSVTSGKEMLLWQALAQIRIFSSGDPDVRLPKETEVVSAMRDALDQ